MTCIFDWRQLDEVPKLFICTPKLEGNVINTSLELHISECEYC